MKRFRTGSRLCVTLALGLLLNACASDAPTPVPRNLILITADTLRADHLQTYGYFRGAAPRIDAFAQEAMVFENCYAPIARTTPSHLSLMTGVYPFEHGISTNFGHISEEGKREQAFGSQQSLETFAQSISEVAHTAGFVSAAPLKRITGLGNGFQTWSEPKGTRRTGMKTNGEVIPWLAKQEEPFFLWVHYMDAHGPYEENDYPPQIYRDLYSVDDELESYLEAREFPASVDGVHVQGIQPALLTNYYDGAIRILDQAVGDLFNAIERYGHWDESVIVFLSDHGQGLGQHGYAGHGDVWSEQLLVPLFIRVPGQAPSRVDPLMSIIDVLPTAMTIGQIFIDEDFLVQAQGMNALDGAHGERPVFGMGGRQAGSFSLNLGDWKYIHRPEGEDDLYSVSKDPFELNNVLGDNHATGTMMRERLLAEIAAQKAAHQTYGAENSGETLDPAHLEQLKALGYTGEE